MNPSWEEQYERLRATHPSLLGPIGARQPNPLSPAEISARRGERRREARVRASLALLGQVPEELGLLVDTTV